MTSGKWAGSRRRDELPPDWEKRRQDVFERDHYRCTEKTAYGRCKEVATDCDHVIPGNDHRKSNLTSLCSAHHALKSAMEGVAARAVRKAAIRRPPEMNPGRAARPPS